MSSGSRSRRSAAALKFRYQIGYLSRRRASSASPEYHFNASMPSCFCPRSTNACPNTELRRRGSAFAFGYGQFCLLAGLLIFILFEVCAGQQIVRHPILGVCGHSFFQNRTGSDIVFLLKTQAPEQRKRLHIARVQVNGRPQVSLRVIEILLLITQVSHQKVQVGMIWRQLVGGIQPFLGLLEVSIFKCRNSMLGFFAGLARHAFVDIEL